MIAPMHPPMVCAIAYNAVSRIVASPVKIPTIPTTGLNDAPDTGANIKMSATNAPPVATALHNNWRATMSVSLSAMIPEPMTATISRPVPIASAASRRDIEIFESVVTNNTSDR
jgi:hypothetical protein